MKKNRKKVKPASSKAQKELADWMKLLLDARGMSVSELARRCGRERADVSKSLTGRREWGYQRIRDYADALLLEPRDVVTIPSPISMTSAFQTIFRPVVDWAMVRPYDGGLSVPQGLS